MNARSTPPMYMECRAANGDRKLCIIQSALKFKLLRNFNQVHFYQNNTPPKTRWIYKFTLPPVHFVLNLGILVFGLLLWCSDYRLLASYKLVPHADLDRSLP